MPVLSLGAMNIALVGDEASNCWHLQSCRAHTHIHTHTGAGLLDMRDIRSLQCYAAGRPLPFFFVPYCARDIEKIKDKKNIKNWLVTYSRSTVPTTCVSPN